MLFSWWTTRRRKKILSEPFPPAWEMVLQQNMYQYPTLNSAERQRIRQTIQILVAEKYWEGCGGFKMTEEAKVTISAQVGLLVLGMEAEYFNKVQSILVYPTSYIAMEKSTSAGQIVTEGPSYREGEAWYRGPVILSWQDTLEAARGHGHGSNLVLHEFAHQLDMLNGRVADGIPPMDSDTQSERWQAVLDEEYEQLRHAISHRQHTLLNSYALTNKSEFFAVATETFFERAASLQAQHSDLYSILQEYYRQDPASRSQPK